MDAEWDEKKRLLNLAKHGVDFNDAAAIFQNSLVEIPGRGLRYGEDRSRF